MTTEQETCGMLGLLQLLGCAGVVALWAATFAIGGWLWLGVALAASGALELGFLAWRRWAA